MNQVLFWIPIKTDWTPQGIPIYGFGLMLFLAFVISTYLAGRRAERQGIPGERLQDIEHLLRQLTRRHEHEGHRVAGSRRRESLQHRQPERERLARAGLRLAAHVAAGERVFDGGLLDGEGLADALGREGIDEFGAQAEFRERGHALLFLSNVDAGWPRTR